MDIYQYTGFIFDLGSGGTRTASGMAELICSRAPVVLTDVAFASSEPTVMC